MVGKTKGVWAAVLILAGANALLLWGAAPRELAPRRDLAALPGEIEGWAEGPVSQAGEVRDFGGDDVLSRGYARQTGERLWLYIGFWRRHREGGPVAISPRRILPGPEWKVVSSRVAWIGGGAGGERTPVRQVVLQRFTERQVVTYWYIQAGDRVVTEWYMGRLAMVWDALRRGRSDVALVRLASSIGQGEAAASLESQRLFAERIAPMLAAHLPG